MTTIARRHLGREIRKARRREQRTGVRTALVCLDIDTHAFTGALERLLTRLHTADRRRPQILHNGRKPR